MTEQLYNFTPSAGSKIEYSLTEQGPYTEIIGLLEVPAIGDTPAQIPTTSLSNKRFETAVDGLMPAPQLGYEFNMEDPSAEANIVKVHSLAISDLVYYWRITLSNGITHSYRSKVKYGYQAVGVNAIAKFVMFHSPIDEIQHGGFGVSL